jgi:predicted metal-binding membrane protein
MHIALKAKTTRFASNVLPIIREIQGVGSSIGLMLMLLALGVMSVAWMSVIAVLIVAQKLLPARAAMDVPVALAIVGLGILIVIAPSSVPGLMPPLLPM